MSNKITPKNDVRQVLSSLKTDCLAMYVDVITQVQDLILFEVANLTEEEAAHITRTLSMIRADLRTLSKAEI